MAWKKSKEYGNVTSYGTSEFQGLPKGGYVCKIKKAEEKVIESGAPMIHIAFDISEGEYKGYFAELYERRRARADNPDDIKWPFEGQAWIVIPDFENPEKESRKFKGFCTSLEESGTDIWSPEGEFNINSVNGAEVGIVFQKQENEYNGNTSWRAVPWAFRSIETIHSGDFYVPKDKPLENKTSYTGISDADLPDSFAAAEDDIPFN